MTENDAIFTTDLALQVDPGAYNVIPNEVRDYMTHKLNRKCSRVYGWVWYDIAWEFEKRLRSVRLCSIGSPSRDESRVWVYNIDSTLYEMYDTQYHEPISLFNNQEPIRTAPSFDSFLSNLKLFGI